MCIMTLYNVLRYLYNVLQLTVLHLRVFNEIYIISLIIKLTFTPNINSHNQ